MPAVASKAMWAFRPGLLGLCLGKCTCRAVALMRERPQGGQACLKTWCQQSFATPTSLLLRCLPTLQVSFETEVAASDGELTRLKSGGPSSSGGGGRMDLGWKYTAPWGYTIIERVTGGRGLSLKVRGGCAVEGHLWLALVLRHGWSGGWLA